MLGLFYGYLAHEYGAVIVSVAAVLVQARVEDYSLQKIFINHDLAHSHPALVFWNS